MLRGKHKVFPHGGLNLPSTAEVNASAYEVIKRQKEFNLLTDVWTLYVKCAYEVIKRQKEFNLLTDVWTLYM
jgi:hypothetical protein